MLKLVCLFFLTFRQSLFFFFIQTPCKYLKPSVLLREGPGFQGSMLTKYLINIIMLPLKHFQSNFLLF